MTMNILGSNYLLSNAIKGVADPAVGFTNGKSISEVQDRVHSDGALYQMNNGQAGDSFTFSDGNGSALFATDKGDTVTLHGKWTDTKQVVQDAVSGIWGRLFTDDKGEKVIVSGSDTNQGADVKIDDTPPPNKDGMTKDKVNSDITTIEDGKNVDGLITKDEIKAALDAGKFDSNPDEKAFWQDNYANFDLLDTENGKPGDSDYRKGGDHLLNAADINYHNAIN